MDEASRELIEHMLAEDQLQQSLEDFVGSDQDEPADDAEYELDVASILQPESKPVRSGPKVAAGTRKTASQPTKTGSITHGARWTEEEDAQLLDGVRRYGQGKWKEISQFIGTRSSLQVKNRARHLFVHCGMEPPSGSLAENVPNAPANEPKRDDLMEVTDERPAPQMDVQSNALKVAPSVITAAPLSAQEDHASDIDIDDAESANRSLGVSGKPKERVAVSESMAADDARDIYPAIAGTALEVKMPVDTASTTDLALDTGVQDPDTDDSARKKDDTDSSEAFDSKAEYTASLPSKSTGAVVDTTIITDKEKAANPEFFRGKPASTPERYMKIRNHILKCWHATKPAYLTKTGARRDLRDCGDVNVIGRVHGYLENIGAINVGCDMSLKPRRPAVPRVRQPRPDQDYKPRERPTAFSVFDDIVAGARRRRVRDEHGDWQVAYPSCARDTWSLTNTVTGPNRISERDLEGRVIEHGVSEEAYRIATDPFLLVPLQPFDEESAAPFSVHIVPSAMAIMDLHAHMLRTEVIGLLGGNFDADSKQLDIVCAFPCRGASTDFQCEMDPESEILARQEFADRGLTVVGWYHSHPTFEPTPSVRDIENQVNYQTLFRREGGQEPFVGVIVNPYDRERLSNQSKMRFFMVGPDYQDGVHYRTPYRLLETSQTEQLDVTATDQLVKQADKLISDFAHHIKRMVFDDSYRAGEPLSVCGKLLESVGSWLNDAEYARGRMLETVQTRLNSLSQTENETIAGACDDAVAAVAITAEQVPASIGIAEPQDISMTGTVSDATALAGPIADDAPPAQEPLAMRQDPY
ncbi:hypothetical protein THASP1DRAFT_27588 [Thamnocephalis sphaerospora]|uniref:Uncharacterized protein n=1 Tax=Thamnocephalis sphaerospora TaxID=78915 RepID=A0A4P9XYV0_9FUNG|nr:hypothetical protein THASP1DRAFT_27588 [Thamnocephalis sphaerospora]|eukprot:RKP10620.1 hypothetical protein THASP1DRAFT_27588 [Thamnocephalis sphaerospora]